MTDGREVNTARHMSIKEQSMSHCWCWLWFRFVSPGRTPLGLLLINRRYVWTSSAPRSVPETSSCLCSGSIRVLDCLVQGASVGFVPVRSGSARWKVFQMSKPSGDARCPLDVFGVSVGGLDPDFCRFFDRLNVVFHLVQRKKTRWHRVLASRAPSCWFNACLHSAGTKITAVFFFSLIIL